MIVMFAGQSPLSSCGNEAEQSKLGYRRFGLLRDITCQEAYVELTRNKGKPAQYNS